jgi:hypothetical protein
MPRDRAKRGGEIGRNGEEYRGGQFLPSTDRPKVQSSKRLGVGRREIEPFVWEEPPTPNSYPIYSLAGTRATLERETGRLVPHLPGIVYYGPTAWGYAIEELCDRYNAGERWVEERKTEEGA